MDDLNISGVIEAILFVAGEPVTIQDIQKNLELTELEVIQAIDELQTQCQEQKRGIVLKRFGNHIQLATCPDYAPYVEKMLQPVQKQSLSQAALETLAVVAYRQPVTRLDVEMVRGVKCDYSIQSLVNKQLIAEAGRKDTVGRPILYATTDRFLSHFGLTSLQDLPEPTLSLPQEREDALPDEAAKEQIIPGNQTETAETI